MAPMAPLAKQEGNTELLATKRESASKMWCFTLNNYSETEYCDIKKSITGNAWIIGKELAPKTNTPHLQGFIHFNEKTRLTALKKINTRIHWEKCKGTLDENVAYCSKDGNYETEILKVRKKLKLLDPAKFYKWQTEIIEIIKKEPDDRTIYWYWEEIGNTGKSSFTKYLCAIHGAVPVEGKKNDILYCASEHESDIYIFDFERSMEDFVSYSAMEKLKNGCYMVGKYESKPIVRNPPHIICFANFKPDEELLSKDRWIIKKIVKPKTDPAISINPADSMKS